MKEMREKFDKEMVQMKLKKKKKKKIIIREWKKKKMKIKKD